MQQVCGVDCCVRSLGVCVWGGGGAGLAARCCRQGPPSAHTRASTPTHHTPHHPPTGGPCVSVPGAPLPGG
jgi:hypothetical protein